ncbi:MAG: hypothetical protein P8M20_06350 [Planctomycetaceae bacterium]|nr:hypothetical protein [Planctomycetaceae bacterium]
MLSERLPSKETPEFARAMANRLWAMLMGRGSVHPVSTSTLLLIGKLWQSPTMMAQFGFTKWLPRRTSKRKKSP